MKRPAPDRRLIVAFFPDNDSAAKGAAEILRKQYPQEDVTFYPAGETDTGQQHAQLRLPDEALVCMWVPVVELATAIHTLQAARARSIFLTAGGVPEKEKETFLEAAENVRTVVDAKTLIATLDRLERAAIASRDYLAHSIGLGHPASPAAQWVIDNSYVIELGIRDIRQELRHSCRKIRSTHLKELLSLAQRFVNQSSARITDEGLRQYLAEAQKGRELPSHQLWSFPLLVRLVLVDQLVNLAVRASRTQQLREEAFLWADRIAHTSLHGEERLRSMVERLEQEPYAQERTFAVALAEQLQEQESALHILQVSIEKRTGTPLIQLVRSEHEREAADSLLAADAFGSIRTLARLDFRKTFEAISLSHAALSKDPSGIYLRSDFTTRDRCRQTIAALAPRVGKTESEVADKAVLLAGSATSPHESQVLFYLIGPGVAILESALNTRPTRRQAMLRWLRAHSVGVYLTSIFLLTAAFTFVGVRAAWDAGIHQLALLGLLGVLAAFPLSELAIQAVHSLVISVFPPEHLPKMNFERGVPDEAGTLVVVPMMLSSISTVQQEVEKLEIRYLANRDTSVSYSLFADYVDAPTRQTDSDAALLREANDGIAALNRKYGENRFLLFHRPRVWSDSEQAWIGWERKRGKLEQLNSFLVGEGDKAILAQGILTHPVHFVITVDADTQLPPGSARRMIETIAHPMNRVQIDEESRIRRSGFTIIQPRVSIALPGASATRFTHLFADAQGTDPYCAAVSDAHQDLFGEAMFHGKAIYDVSAFYAILSHRFPAETLLSHDLIEGAHVGVALASDIEILENLPLDYPGFARRQHRWIRGDWQIASWAAGHVIDGDRKRTRNSLSFINRWRIVDNLRRSVVPIAAVLLLAFGWFVSAAPGVWTVVLALAVATPALAPFLDRWSRHIEGTVYGLRGAADDLKRAVVILAFLPHQAWINGDAIIRALHRLLVSRRDLLEWQTAADASSRTAVQSTWRQLLVIAAFACAALLILTRRGSFGPTFLFLGMWMSAPWLMDWLGKSDTRAMGGSLGRLDTAYLRRLARSTWRYFDDLVGPETNWLPPDNSQVALNVEIAQRTSPTNIGLWLNSAQSAHDMGYLTIDEFVRRCSLSFESIAKLERYEGHLLNWYETRHLRPLAPHYVSTVDSGNLIASLWVLRKGCEQLPDAPLLSGALDGLADSVAMLHENGGKDPSVALILNGLRPALAAGSQGVERIGRLRLAAYYAAQLKETERWSGPVGGEKSYWANKVASDMEAWGFLINRYFQWIEVLSQVSDADLQELGQEAIEWRTECLSDLPSLRSLAGDPSPGLEALLERRASLELRPELASWIQAVRVEYERARNNARETLQQLEHLSGAADKLASEINMRFLYDASRRLFGIGYAVGSPMTFTSHYDLLASECRLASLVAIAKGEVPVEHWFALGRSRVSTPTRQALLSWSGTMFEYLMPVLFTEAFQDSLLEEAVRKAVEAQIAYGNTSGLPWGTSECAYSALDANQTYQYKAFGVPALALNPDADPGPVVAPYATALALMADPAAAVQNLYRLERAGAAGTMGFYEAIDYTRPREEGKTGVVIFTYMAHHQGMTLLALCNRLQNRVVQQRFHSDPRVRAVESLLCERMPISRVEAEEIVRPRNPATPVRVQQRVWTSPTPLPHVHLSSNGRYSLMVTNNGGGYSRWNGQDVTRWRSDTARDTDGSYVWLRDLRGGPAWSPSAYPAGDVGDSTVTFTADRAEFRRRYQDLEAKLEIAVATGDDAELRRLTMNNRSLRTRHVEITTYMELAMASHLADAAHPLFAKMFVETEAPERGVLLAHRRPRSPEETPLWVASVLTGWQGPIEFETDRYVFPGRNRDLAQAVAAREEFAGKTGAVLDPIFAFRCRISLQARERRELAMVTIAGNSREAVMELVRKYQAPQALTHAFEMVWTRAQLEFRYLRIGASSAHRFEELAGHLLFPNPTLRPSAPRLVRSTGGQSALWKYSISGDLPLLVATAADMQATALIRELLLAHSYLRMCGLEVDFVILNREESGYQSPVQEALTRLIHAHATESGRPGAGKVYLLNWRNIAEPDRDLFLSAACVVLGGHLGPLQQQLMRAADIKPAQRIARAEKPTPLLTEPLLTKSDLVDFNGLGGFISGGAEYVMQLGGSVRTPTAWSNVLANEQFGTVVTEAGLGFTWHRNSQRNRLTPWHNDPICDPQSEVIYLRDEESGDVWSPTPSPVRETLPYRIAHGQGYSRYEHESHEIAQELDVFVALTDPVKLCVLRLTNRSFKQKKLSATHMAEWVLGSVKEQQQVHVATWYQESGVILARQTWTPPFEGFVAFSSASPEISSYTADRIAFFGGVYSGVPGSLDGSALDGRTGAGLDPCAALQVKVPIPPGRTVEVVFVLGQAETEDQAVALAQRYRSAQQANAELARVRDWWNARLGVLQVSCPEPDVNCMVNRWLLYQVLACRYWARSAMHQSGGAIGFRDQLQDSIALIYAKPELTRAHLLRAAARQFHAGDVQHWWHPESGMGVRTRCSDDLLWLPWAVARYLERTQDTGVLGEHISFIEGPELEKGEQEKLFTPTVSFDAASLGEHCRLAIEHAFQLGSHGLPLFGNGDWNDGMNRVGIEGRGESVWLGWFLLDVLRDWIELMKNRDPDTAKRWASCSADLKLALEQHAWDGAWYLRGFFDNGAPLGSERSAEAQIDSIAQSWAILCGQADASRAAQALESAASRLVHAKESLVQLLDPPFDKSTPHPGYIMGYPRGVRENGGQYTHAALWLAQAFARTGDGDTAVRILRMLNPAERTRSRDSVIHYRGEPYAAAGDVSFAPGREGIAGWTWYTGSAGWMYRIWLEEIFGFQLRGNRLRMVPKLPDDWPGFRLTYHYGKSVYQIVVEKQGAGSSVAMECDGRDCGDSLDLVDDGLIRKVTVRMGAEKLIPVGASNKRFD